jgi:hypothetical protein
VGAAREPSRSAESRRTARLWARTDAGPRARDLVLSLETGRTFVQECADADPNRAELGLDGRDDLGRQRGKIRARADALTDQLLREEGMVHLQKLQEGPAP